MNNSNNKKIKPTKDTVISKKLKRTPYVPGVSGLTHIYFFERIRGMSDARNNQVINDEKYTETPYVLRMNDCLMGYINKTYSLVIQDLSDLYMEVSMLNTEINNLRNRDYEEITESGEEAIRQFEAKNARIQSNNERADEIRLRTAYIKERLETVDESLKHHIEHADKITRSHISEYWRGFLKGSGDNPILPAYPLLREFICEGLIIYLDHKARINVMINNTLSEEEGGNNEEAQ